MAKRGIVLLALVITGCGQTGGEQRLPQYDRALLCAVVTGSDVANMAVVPQPSREENEARQQRATDWDKLAELSGSKSGKSRAQVDQDIGITQARVLPKSPRTDNSDDLSFEDHIKILGEATKQVRSQTAQCTNELRSYNFDGKLT